MIARILGGKFGIYIVGIASLLSFSAGYQVCDWRHSAAETVQAKTHIQETNAAIERVTREGRDVEDQIAESRRDAERDVRAADRSDALNRPVDDLTGCVLIAALERRPASDCEPESSGEVQPVSERATESGEGE